MILSHLGFALLALSFLMPGHYLPWTSFEQQVVAALGVSLLGISTLARRHESLRMPPSAWLALAVAFVPWIQWAAGQVYFLSDALLSSSYLVAFALAVVIGASPRSGSSATIETGVATALPVAAVVSTFIAVLQMFGQNWLNEFQSALAESGPPFGNLNQRNHFATLLALGIAATLLFYEQRRLSDLWATVCVAWLSLGMIMSQSRTGWVFAGLLLAWVWVAGRRAQLRLSPVAATVAVLLFAAGVLAWNPLTDHLLLTSETIGSRLTPGTRLENWRTLADAALRSPWIGYGWGQVTFAQQAAVLDHRRTGEWLLSSHNIVLDLVLWNGMPLGLLLVAAVIVWFTTRALRCKTPLAWALLAGCAAIWLHALLEYPLEYSYFLLPLGLMMGRLDAGDDVRRVVRLPRSVFAAALVAATALLGWISAEYLTTQETTRQLRMVMSKIGVDKSPSAPAPDVVLLDQIREYHRFWLVEIAPHMTDEQLLWMGRVVRRQASAAALQRYAQALGLNGRVAEAEHTLGLLCSLHERKRCAASRAAWKELQASSPALAAVKFPVSDPT